MPKLINSRRFLKSVRNSASPLSRFEKCDGKADPTFSSVEQQEFFGMKIVDLIGVIKTRLQHQLPSERCIGADMIFFLTAKQLSQLKSDQFSEIIAILSALLLDRAENVRFASIDALCYLSSLTNQICGQLAQNSNVFQSIMAMLERYFLSIESWTKPKFTDNKLTLYLYVDCFNLLGDLCGSSSQFVDVLLSHPKTGKIFLKAFQVVESCEKFCFIPIAISAAQCLLMICEGDRVNSAIFQNDSSTSNLSNVLQLILNLDISTEKNATRVGSLLCLKSLLISIASYRHFKKQPLLLMNPSQENKIEILEKLSTMIREVFSIECSTVLKESIEQLSELIKFDLSSEIKKLQEIKQLSEKIKYFLLTRRNCIELLTNLFSSEDDVDCDNQSDGEDESDKDYEEDMLTDSDASAGGLPTACDPLLLKLVQNNSITNILELQFSNYGFTTETEHLFERHVIGKDIFILIQTLKISALSFVHNLVSLKLLPQTDQLVLSIWKISHDMAFNNNLTFKTSDPVLKEQEIEIREEAINLVREFISNYKVDSELNMANLESLCCFAKTNSNSISGFTKVNIVRIMAAVATTNITRSLAVQSTSHTETVEQFVEQTTSLLLNGYRIDTDLVLRAEILDSLIDIYSDDNPLSHALIKRMNLLCILKEFADQFRQEMKANPSIARQNAVVSTVSLNLKRFINYKQKMIR